MDRTLRNTAASDTTANEQLNQGKGVGGFKGKRHSIETKNRISQTQKARYNYMRQMLRQHKQQNEQAEPFGPIDTDIPSFEEKVKNVLREVLREELKKATPIRREIPIF